MTSATERPLTRADLSDDLRPDDGWSTWSREIYWRLRAHFLRENDPRTVLGRHSRALRGAQIALLRRATCFSASHQQIAEALGTSLRNVELAKADLRAAAERPTLSPRRIPRRIPRREQLR